MKVGLGAVLAVGLFFSAVSLYAAEGVTLTTPKEKLSYVIGVQIGSDMKNQSLDVDPAIIGKGLQDSMGGKELLSRMRKRRRS